MEFRRVRSIEVWAPHIQGFWSPHIVFFRNNALIGGYAYGPNDPKVYAAYTPLAERLESNREKLFIRLP